MKVCPFCQKEVQDNAFKCKFCGGWFSNDAEVKQKESDNEERMKKLLQPKEEAMAEETDTTTQYFSVSTQKMVAMSILCCGFYELYWFYRNWRAIMMQEDKKLSPFWRTVFSAFYCYSLFKRVILSAAKRGYRDKQTPGGLAALYIVMVIVAAKAPAPYDLIGLFSFIPLIYANNAIRHNNLTVNPQYQEQQKLTKGEIIFMIVGVLFWALTILNLILPEPPPV